MTRMARSPGSREGPLMGAGESSSRWSATSALTRSLALAVLLGAFHAPLEAQRDSGPTATGSIRISVSIASSYRLQRDGATDRSRGQAANPVSRLCIKSSARLRLPVTVALLSTEEPLSSPASPSPEKNILTAAECDSSTQSLPAGEASDPGAHRLAIVRPE
jgi:hypothetical protein